METFKTSKISWKLVACCFVLLVVFVLTVGAYLDERNVNTNPSIAYSEDSEVIPLVNSNYGELSTVQNEVELAGPKEEVAYIYSINSYITTYEEDIELLCKAFGVDKEDIISNLKEVAKANSDKAFETTNVGFLLDSKGNVKTFANDLYGLVEYFYNYVKKNPKKVKNKRVAYKGDADYVEKLIIYFSEHIYTDVDTTTALSIGAAESGYITMPVWQNTWSPCVRMLPSVAASALSWPLLQRWRITGKTESGRRLIPRQPVSAAGFFFEI